MESPHGPDKILLAGFSGAGKSTVLRELAKAGAGRFRSFIDLDRETLGTEFPDVARLVAVLGWEGFRAREEKALRRLLRAPGPAVIALGGGTLERGWEVLAEYPEARVCHLDCPFDLCWRRLRGDAQVRPLAQGGEQAMRDLYQRRVPLYARADWRVDATQTPEEVALAILRGPE